MKYIRIYESVTMRKRVVITGSPGTGKSSVCDSLEQMGYIVVPEPARILITKYQKDSPELLPWNNRTIFQKNVEDMCISDYNSNVSGFFDRSLVDEIGFRINYDMDVPGELIKNCNRYRYDMVFIFPPWKEIFVNDDVRKETFEESIKIHDSILKGYTQVGYSPIEVPKGSINYRINFILNRIENN